MATHFGSTPPKSIVKLGGESSKTLGGYTLLLDYFSHSILISTKVAFELAHVEPSIDGSLPNFTTRGRAPPLSTCGYRSDGGLYRHIRLR